MQPICDDAHFDFTDAHCAHVQRMQIGDMDAAMAVAKRIESTDPNNADARYILSLRCSPPATLLAFQNLSSAAGIWQPGRTVAHARAWNSVDEIEGHIHEQCLRAALPLLLRTEHLPSVKSAMKGNNMDKCMADASTGGNSIGGLHGLAQGSNESLEVKLDDISWHCLVSEVQLWSLVH
jgi:hypothetical protein